MLGYIFSPMMWLAKTLHPPVPAPAHCGPTSQKACSPLRCIPNRQWKAVLLPNAEKKKNNNILFSPAAVSRLTSPPLVLVSTCQLRRASLVGRGGLSGHQEVALWPQSGDLCHQGVVLRQSAGRLLLLLLLPLLHRLLLEPQQVSLDRVPKIQPSLGQWVLSHCLYLCLLWFLPRLLPVQDVNYRKLTKMVPATLLQPKSATRRSSWMWRSEGSQSTWSRNSTPSRCPEACSTTFTSYTPVGRR